MNRSANAGGAACDKARWSVPADQILPGRALKFHILWQARLVEGFVVNFGGCYFAFVNRCAHAGIPLDWWPDEFFSDNGRLLICRAHGSYFEPDTGKCAGGPCAGSALVPLHVHRVGDQIVVTPHRDAFPSAGAGYP
jgi:nitrite reductase/ring-hydroxylating ferredoxin subunit